MVVHGKLWRIRTIESTQFHNLIHRPTSRNDDHRVWVSRHEQQIFTHISEGLGEERAIFKRQFVGVPH